MTNKEYKTKEKLADLGVTVEQISDLLGIKLRSVNDMLAPPRPLPKWIKSLELATGSKPFYVEVKVLDKTERIITTSETSMKLVKQMIRQHGEPVMRLVVKPIKP